MSEESLEDKALALIKSRPNGVLQSDLWKDLDIDSRKCSRVIANLEEEGKIKRTWETVKGTRTYRITYLPQKKEAPKKEVDFSVIMAEEHVAPCVGCTYECEPDYCPDLGNWIDLLARVAAKEAAKAGRAAAKAEAEKEKVPEEEEIAAPVSKKAAKAPKPAKEEKAAKAPAKKTVLSAKKGAKPAKEIRPVSKPAKGAKSGKK